MKKLALISASQRCCVLGELNLKITLKKCVNIGWVVDPYSFFPDPDPEVDVGDQYGSGSGSRSGSGSNTDSGL